MLAHICVHIVVMLVWHIEWAHLFQSNIVAKGTALGGDLDLANRRIPSQLLRTLLGLA